MPRTQQTTLIYELAESILRDVRDWRFDASRPTDPVPTVERVLYERSSEWGRDNVLRAIERLAHRKRIKLVATSEAVRIVAVGPADDAA